MVEGDVAYLQGTIYDVRRGVMGREGRLRLVAPRRAQDALQRCAPPPGGLAALSAFLLSGQPSALVSGPEPAAASPERPAAFRRW